MTTLEIIGFCVGSGLLLFMLCGMIWAWRQDVKDWNKGVCDSCYDGVWTSSACDSGGCSLYKCSNCDISWWENGYGSKVELNPNTSQDIIRSMKLKKLHKNIA